MPDRPLTLEAPDRPGAAADAPRRALARRRHGRREGDPHPPARRRAALLGAARLLRRPRRRSEGRAHVALRGGRQRGDRIGRARRGTFRAEDLAQRIAELVRDRQGACAPRSRSPRATPSTSRRPCRASTRRRSTRSTDGARLRARQRGASSASPRRDDGLPVRPAADRRLGARAPAGAGFRRGGDRGDLRGGAARHPQTSAASARSTSARPSPERSRSTRGRCIEIVENSMSSEIYELMKRVDEVARRREGASPPPLRRGLRARDDPRRARAATGAA